MEPVAGIEPASPVYKTGALPLCYTGEMVPGIGIEPTSEGPRPSVLPLNEPGKNYRSEAVNTSKARTQPTHESNVLSPVYETDNRTQSASTFVVGADGIEPPLTQCTWFTATLGDLPRTPVVLCGWRRASQSRPHSGFSGRGLAPRSYCRVS